MKDLEDTYDEIPYPSGTHEETDPDRLCVLGTLFGMAPAPIERARVLEIGCGDGANLIPMAFHLPEASFLGIDRAGAPIASGQARIARLGLGNLTLRRLDILDTPGDLGTFDYVLCHGVYSWVPRAVQDALLALFRRHLAPHGIAYVSYDTLPGGHLRRIGRDMMRLHTSHLTGDAKVKEARSILDLVAKGVPPLAPPGYAEATKAAATNAANLPDAALLHDDLADIKDPIYFYEFVDRANANQLQFLAETDFGAMQKGPFSPEVQAFLGHVEDVVTREQYIDFLRGRSFRRTLLCHEGVALDRSLAPTALRALAVRSLVHPLSDNPDVKGTTEESFKTPEGVVLSTRFPLTKAALTVLSELAPQALSFEELLAQACARAGDHGPTEGDRKELGDVLLQLYGGAAIQLHSRAPSLCRDVGVRPLVSALVRMQSAAGTEVTNLLHQNVRLDGKLAELVALLDGTRDKPSLLEAIEALAASGRWPLGDAAEAETRSARIALELDEALAKFARGALLTG